MARIVFRPFYSLRGLVGSSEIEVQARSADDLLRDLEERYGETFREMIYDDKGRLRSYTYLYVNNRLKKWPEEYSSPLSEGDIIVLIPPITPNG